MDAIFQRIKYVSLSNVEFKFVSEECCVGLSLKKEWVVEILNRAVLEFMLDISVGGLIRFTHHNDTHYCFQRKYLEKYIEISQSSRGR